MPDDIKDDEENVEEEEVIEESEVIDYLNMSDDDFAKLPEPSFEIPAEETSEQEDVEQEDTTEEEVESEEETVDEDNQDDSQEDDDTETEESSDEDSEEEKESNEKKPKKDEDVVDYEALYKQVTAPFKANGKEMTAKSPEDIVALMQMGANYSKKMRDLKPGRKVLKLLEQNGLVDEDVINNLIDLNNKNPDAIKKLLKDSNIDLDEIDLEEDNTYTPTDRTVSDIEMDLDEVMENIKDSPSFPKTIDIVTKQWDEESGGAVIADPQAITIINEHVSNGTYDTIMSSVEYERGVGRLKGVSDFDAYRMQGDALYKQGELTSYPLKKEAPPKKVVERIKNQDKKKSTRKKSLGSVRKTKTPSNRKMPNPLTLSDEEFEKTMLNKIDL